MGETGYSLGDVSDGEPQPVIRSLNGGLTWTLQTAGLRCDPVSQCSQIRFADASHGYVFGPGFASTADGGTTWTTWPVTVEQLVVRSAPYRTLRILGRCTRAHPTRVALQEATSGGRWRTLDPPAASLACPDLEASGSTVLLQTGDVLWLSHDDAGSWERATVPCPPGMTAGGTHVAADGTVDALCTSPINEGRNTATVELLALRGQWHLGTPLTVSGGAGPITALGHGVALFLSGGPHVTTLTTTQADGRTWSTPDQFDASVPDYLLSSHDAGTTIRLIADADELWTSTNGGRTFAYQSKVIVADKDH